MGEVRVRNLDAEVVRELREQARRRGMSLESSLRSLLAEEAFRPRRELSARARELRDEIRGTVGELDDSTPLIRAERDRRPCS